MKNIFELLLGEKIDFLKYSFGTTAPAVFYDEKTKELIHPGEYGMYREAVCADFIKLFIPARLQVGTGFLINTDEQISTQCDIVVYDPDATPLIKDDKKQRFFPVESVCAIGEIKSILTKSTFKKAINKLAEVKMLREAVKSPSFIRRESFLKSRSYDPKQIPYDNVFSFLICERLDFDISNIATEINGMYHDGVEQHQRHNLILSLNDGLLAYHDNNGVTVMYPFLNDNTVVKNRFVRPGANSYIHFKQFASFMFLASSSGTILYPELSHYIGDIMGGMNQDEAL